MVQTAEMQSSHLQGGDRIISLIQISPQLFVFVSRVRFCRLELGNGFIQRDVALTRLLHRHSSRGIPG